MLKMKLVANNEVLIEKTFSENTVKAVGEIDDVNDLNNNLSANLKLNYMCIAVAKQIMNNHDICNAKLYVTNSYFKEPTTADFDI